jgi:hypothetical protein
MRSSWAYGLVLWTFLACRSASDSKPTREDCTRVSEHVADLIMTDSTADPDGLWDAIHAEPGDSEIPATIDKPAFKTWLDSPEGKTWLLQRRGNVLAGTQHGIDGCVEKGSKTIVRCLLAAKTKTDVDACDASAH